MFISRKFYYLSYFEHNVVIYFSRWGAIHPCPSQPPPMLKEASSSVPLWVLHEGYWWCEVKYAADYEMIGKTIYIMRLTCRYEPKLK